MLDFLLTEPLPTAPLDDVGAAWTRHRVAANRFAKPVDIALAGGFGADRLGYAFLSGYQEAVRTLIPDLASDELVALCATESGGGHPAAIETTVTEVDGETRLNGTKTFATLGMLAHRLVVIASVGADLDGRNRLRATVVELPQPGVRVTSLPATPFAPEIPHATVNLTDAVATVLPGDGYLDYLKPFRTIEDIHVLAAALGWLVRVARAAGWPRPVLERVLAGVAAVRGLDIDAPGSPGVHIALGAVFEYLRCLVDELDSRWESADSLTRERWERDRPLLAVAGRAREQRLATAWRSVLSAVERPS